MEQALSRLLIVVLTNAGGEGKTLLALLIQCLLSLIGEPVGFLDADEGNYSGTIQLHNAGEGANVKTVSWSAGQAKAAAIVKDHIGKHAVLDGGANMTASHRDIVDLLPEIQQQMAAQGYRTVVLMPVSTNKVGAVQAIKDLAPKVEGYEKMFVRVDRDGSNRFEEGLDASRTIELAHLAPGFQAYIRGTGGGFLVSVTSPPQGYAAAAAHVTQWMRLFAQQPAVVDLLGMRVIEALNRLERGTPPAYRFAVTTVEQTTDAELAINAHRSRAMSVLDKGGWSAAAFSKVAELMQAGQL